MKYFRGSTSILAASALVASALVTGCSPGRDEADPDGTVTVTYSSSTSNAPTTQTVTSSPSPGGGGAGTDGNGGGSGGSGGTGGSPTTSGGSGTDSSGGASTSPGSPAATSGQSTSAPASNPTDAGSYADAFVRAWGRGDRATAARLATASAVSSLFGQRSSGGGGWQRQGIAYDGGNATVTYADGTDRLGVRLDVGAAGEGRDGAITGATLTTGGGDSENGDDTSGATLPTTITGYADAFVRAWGKGEASAWTYTTAGVESSFGAAHPSGGAAWARASSSGSTVTYSTRDGGTLVLTLDPAQVGVGAQDAITAASLS